ncbi:MAG: hypothetical protein QNK59_08220, partial [Flavobacteriales bacterium]
MVTLTIVTLACSTPAGLCSSAYVDAPPTLDITPNPNLANPTILTPVTNIAGDTIYLYTEVYPGDTVRFNIASSDAFPHPDCSPQNINFSASGGNLSSAANYGNANACLFNPPCATITSGNPGGVFTNPGINTVEFNWYVDCSHLFYQEYQCGTLKSEYSYYIRMQDDQCPLNRIAYQKIVVRVKNYMPRLPDVSGACVSLDASGVSFDW